MQNETAKAGKWESRTSKHDPLEFRATSIFHRPIGSLSFLSPFFSKTKNKFPSVVMA